MRVLLDRPLFVLGRGSAADVTIPHPAVSRRHAAIEKRGETYRLVDLSGRGTKVSGRPVEEAILEEGDRIELGDYLAHFSTERIRDEDTRVDLQGTKELRAIPEERPGALVLRVRTGDREAVLPLRGAHLVGTDPTCSIVLDDPYASARHCKLDLVGDRPVVVDLGSTNGTWVNGVRVGQAELGLGAWVRVGRSDLIVEPEDRRERSEFEGILSRSPAMREVFDRIERIAPSMAPVAIFGETGTGKELVARAIHNRSGRKGPFIPVNCAAISPELVESELFGHEKGAFTGATSARKGAFEEAEGGTLFLDEIGELPLALQAKLLRTLEAGEVRRVGSSRPFRVDVRVVAATHRDLRAMAREGTFREDLYFRLSVIRIDLPPLRARVEDIALLAEHLLGRYAPPGGPLPRFTNDALVRLASHRWPGNVRELRNVLARALLLRKGPEITAEDLFFDSEEGAHLEPAAAVSEDDRILLPG
ncbi:MAG TPA: sigma 54-interacting transcriptional regulator, partial [Fredinandcohnia sp.]|nr:sigma 54-interacting transcriptional regulator [Fredinandcohnia sp.]